VINILTLNKISETGLGCLEKDKFNVVNACENPDGIILRSFSMHDMELPASLKGVARAGAGYNNIPVDKCAEKGIVVFNTPGANANAVKELVIAGLLLSARKICQGVGWAKGLAGTFDVPGQVEKGKAAFGGTEISGKTIGVVGIGGAIGLLVANACHALGMNVIGSDPFLSDRAKNALHPDIRAIKADRPDEYLRECDYVTVHVPYGESTRHMINEEALNKFKKGAVLVNMARGELVDDAAVVAALNGGALRLYVTDFPNGDLIGHENVVATPHLGASTEESEENCAAMAAAQLKDYLECGNIKNSVNYPDCAMNNTGRKRVLIHFKQMPGIEGAVIDVFMRSGADGANEIHKYKNGFGYAIVEPYGVDCAAVAEQVAKLSGVLKVRVI